MMPLAIVIPHRNEPDKLMETVWRLATSEWMPSEIVVVDDASTEAVPWAALDSFSHMTNVEVVTIQLPKQKGPPGAALVGLGMIKQPYLYFASVNDEVSAGFFYDVLPGLMKYPDVGLGCADPLWRNGSGSSHRQNLPFKEGLNTGEDVRSRIKGGWIPGHSTIFKVDAFLEAGGIPEELRWHCDWFTYLVMGFRSGCFYAPVEGPTYTLGHGYSSEQAGIEEVRASIKSFLLSDRYADVLAAFVSSGVLKHVGVSL